MKLQVSCQLDYQVHENAALILMLRPQSGIKQEIVEGSLVITPQIPIVDYKDHYGNLCNRLLVPVGPFSVKTTSIGITNDTIEVDYNAGLISVENLPAETLVYIVPSRYCESDKLSSLAYEITQNFSPGYPQVEAIRQWIKANIRYEYGHSLPTTSAYEMAQSRIGVCRDFSHLGISLCRALNIPARMVVGYLHELNPMDLHAWFEAYVGDRWYTFDATQDVPKGNRIVIAYGRDASDVAFATQFGNMELLNMQVTVEAVL